MFSAENAEFFTSANLCFRNFLAAPNRSDLAPGLPPSLPSADSRKIHVVVETGSRFQAFPALKQDQSFRQLKITDHQNITGLRTIVYLRYLVRNIEHKAIRQKNPYSPFQVLVFSIANLYSKQFKIDQELGGNFTYVFTVK